MWSAQACGSAWPMARACGGCRLSLQGRSRMCWYSGVQNNESWNDYATLLWCATFISACDGLYPASGWLSRGPLREA